MIEKQIKLIRAEIEDFKISTKAEAEEFKRLYTGKKGALNHLFNDFKQLPGQEKAKFGKVLNELKQYAFQKYKEGMEATAVQSGEKNTEDLTLPGIKIFQGSRHPLSIVLNRILSIFRRIGFSIADGPEVEDSWHNFTALNFPENHPAMDMQDTFFLRQNPEYLLRTHTSNVQIRAMEAQKPPIRILAPGRVYRNETISARAHCFFHQVEGLYVDEAVSFPEMVQVLDYFAKSMFGAETATRLRPSYFPFTEISAEMDVSCLICKGEGCAVCKGTGWVEVLGCGMVDPNVLENCKIDPDKYSGYAFGMGVERTAQLLFRVPDLRLYSQNDVRFLAQFEHITPH